MLGCTAASCFQPHTATFTQQLLHLIPINPTTLIASLVTTTTFEQSVRASDIFCLSMIPAKHYITDCMQDSTTMSLLLEGTSEGRGQCIRATATSRDPLDTLSVTSTNRPSMPCNDASSSKRKNYLEYQLDSLRGIEVLGGLRFLPGLDKRLNGGVQFTVLPVGDLITTFLLFVGGCVWCTGTLSIRFQRRRSHNSMCTISILLLDFSGHDGGVVRFQ